MVLFFSCSTSSLGSTDVPSSDFHYELSSGCCNPSQPIPFRSSIDVSCDDDFSVEQFNSPLSSSADSISSIKSSCSSRSFAEREMERAQRRQLLDSSLLKIRDNVNLPLRKHLLVFNTIKQLQRDLDILDDEELYCNLLGVPSCESGAVGERMDVDECWMGVNRGELKTTKELAVAPPVQEEHDAFVNLNDDGFEMDDLEGDDVSKPDADTKTWSWSTSGNELGFFNSFEGVREPSAAGLGWSSQLSENAWGCDDANRLCSWGGSGFDLWSSSSDPLGGGRFELQHLFPSQVLLQA